jgi:endonuclease YncB( thermonuclease family)
VVLRFPADRVYQRRRSRRSIKSLLTSVLLATFFVGAWYFNEHARPMKQIPTIGQKIQIADGDSFAIGPQKLRLKGIDAPEYNQTCKDSRGADWPCGRTARAALDKLLRQPGLACEAQVHDRYARLLATCRTNSTPNIAAAQVLAGMAVSDAYYGSRSFGKEEDIAAASKRGIWQGDFVRPRDFRALFTDGAAL